MSDKPLLTAEQVAERLQVDDSTVRRWANAGLIPVVRMPGGATLRFRAEDVDALVELEGETA